MRGKVGGLGIPPNPPNLMHPDMEGLEERVILSIKQLMNYFNYLEF